MSPARVRVAARGRLWNSVLTLSTGVPSSGVSSTSPGSAPGKRASSAATMSIGSCDEDTGIWLPPSSSVTLSSVTSTDPLDEAAESVAMAGGWGSDVTAVAATGGGDWAGGLAEDGSLLKSQRSSSNSTLSECL